MKNSDRLEKLKSLFLPGEKVIVAFSGGVDSTFLLYVLARLTEVDVMGITIKTPYIPQWEVDEAIDFCKQFDIKHNVIELPFPKSVITNPGDRCYRCKTILFSKVTEYARSLGYSIVADGSNADDTKEYRPGLKALEELQVRSPLLETGFPKSEIREYLKEFELEVWNKPAYACLLTRIPHDTAVDQKMLFMVEEAELFLKEIGFAGTRVRLHGDIARLECNPDYFITMINDPFRSQISARLKQLGFKYVTIDVDGYRTGSMNSTIR